MGPVQVLVVGYEQPAFTGEVLAELTRLSDAGLVRLVDVLLVTRAADGTFHTVEVSEAATEGLPDLPQGRGELRNFPSVGCSTISIARASASVATRATVLETSC